MVACRRGGGARDRPSVRGGCGAGVASALDDHGGVWQSGGDESFNASCVGMRFPGAPISIAALLQYFLGFGEGLLSLVLYLRLNGGHIDNRGIDGIFGRL